MNFLRDRAVFVLGLGESGAACAAFAHSAGARVTVADTRLTPPAQWLAQCEALAGITIRLGALNTEDLVGIQTLVASPGLSPHVPDIRAFLEHARQLGIEIVSELDWFQSALDELASTQDYHPKVLAITGTNGKTTTTELCAHLCNESGKSAIACGNISPAALAALSTALQNNYLPDVWVLELSSFQLHYTQKLQATAATVLNLTQDHLDWHADMAEYAADKRRIFSAHTRRVLNRDDPSYATLSHKQATHASFGLSMPARLGDMGCVNDGTLNWLVAAIDAEPERKRRKHDAVVCAAQRLMPADALRIRGSHNHSNALAALLLVQSAGVSLAQGLGALRSYAGAPHRCEPVNIIDGVEYINDSKGTNVGATVAAIQGLCDGKQRLILIAGGVGKGQDFAPLKAAVMLGCSAVLLIGEASEAIEQALADSGVMLQRCSSLNEAVHTASELARSGEAVLLSPACASFDQFKNYAHRAEVFIDAVNELSLMSGGVS